MKINKSSKETTSQKETESNKKSKSSKEKSGRKKNHSTGSRWTAIILLIVTIVLSLIFMAKGKLSQTPSQEPDESTGNTWQFTIENKD